MHKIRLSQYLTGRNSFDMCQENIKLEFKNTVSKDVDWINFAHIRVQWWVSYG